MRLLSDALLATTDAADRYKDSPHFHLAVELIRRAEQTGGSVDDVVRELLCAWDTQIQMLIDREIRRSMLEVSPPIILP